ncbi:hypothetical protein K493DRAFT_303039 [Basidiobolus meristosporus CBS 931.73]|uniref:C2H2-type domain-containing protein n=1 Tax=Basidiobolus meristosporus CBS 931.73 TaxID=1314790 RepID=A0A1Y1Y4D8_9FUNG|nr:hypothetical protein K493DRAFT_303039 [Basidiobolus meristosporus CBS 931.73]|eukprot:ORX92891.1 hypothetical protein K493DRAFT_303039 [Basidiobolus meristosporus CBS 931.73]
MTSVLSSTSTPPNGLNVKLRLSQSEVSSVPQTDSSPDTTEPDSTIFTQEKPKETSDSTSSVDTTPSKRPLSSPDSINRNGAPIHEDSIANNAQVDTKLAGVERPRKWQKRALVIRTLTGEVSFSSWRPDGPPLVKRPVVVEKFNSPHPVVDSTRPVPCTYPGCNRNFADQNGLTKHMVVHGPKTFFCGLDGAF